MEAIINRPSAMRGKIEKNRKVVFKMAWNIEAIVWFLVLLDSIGANLAIWLFPGLVKWYKKNYKWVYKHLPLTKGWALWYLVLVLWVGYGLYRLGFLTF